MSGGLKLVVLCFALAAAVFFGMELAERGIETVYGPVDPGEAGIALDATRLSTADPEPLGYPPIQDNGALDIDRAVDRGEAIDRAEPGLDYVARKIGGLLQIVAHHGIETIVSLFEKLVL